MLVSQSGNSCSEILCLVVKLLPVCTTGASAYKTPYFVFFFFSQIFLFSLWVGTFLKEGPSCFMCFPYGSAGKESTCNAGDLGWIPGLERSPGEAKGYTLQYSGLGNAMDRRLRGITKSRTQLSDFHFPVSLVSFLFSSSFCQLNSTSSYILS